MGKRVLVALAILLPAAGAGTYMVKKDMLPKELLEFFKASSEDTEQQSPSTGEGVSESTSQGQEANSESTTSETLTRDQGSGGQKPSMPSSQGERTESSSSSGGTKEGAAQTAPVAKASEDLGSDSKFAELKKLLEGENKSKYSENIKSELYKALKAQTGKQEQKTKFVTIVLKSLESALKKSGKNLNEEALKKLPSTYLKSGCEDREDWEIAALVDQKYSWGASFDYKDSGNVKYWADQLRWEYRNYWVDKLLK
ncbi:hypothetical protein MHLP_03670 [Candidatus Mycoplasma haematolamae str. Purdue]|uniref:Uncharacterized protein n=1 Tax=Mycoplasma haematolamae (strain Purdue) TaxID=1212765 RepID=I7CK93_MYCHA|nr:hypothetical protein [Candidatus Mycoplasma haematolamae]AFO52314.1 hypothetical protein MHLP_03670 [Candidatus Mycoplasma haematolamae str. Purdue]